MVEYSIRIRNALVVDGSGRAPYKADIGLKKGKVAVVGDVKGDAVDEIDAKGLIAIPGFIDSHSHGDFGILWFNKCESYVYQGVTTMVTGNCGISPAPLGDNISLPGIASEHLLELELYKYYPTHTVYPRERVNEVMMEKYGWTVDWYSMGDWFDRIEKKGISINMATLVGHGTVRSTVMGDDFKRHSERAEREEMSALIRQALDDGCIGLSVGLDYDPDVFADRSELVEHISILKDYGAIFVPHSRRTGRRRNVTVDKKPHNPIDGLKEVIDICRATGVRMNIAHIFTGWHVTPIGSEIMTEANRKATLAIIDDAINEGLDVSFDVMPTNMVSPYMGASFLCYGFEPWVREKGSREEFAKWLKAADYRQEIKEAIKAGKWYTRDNPNLNPLWAENRVIFKHSNHELEGKTMAKIAEDRNKDPFEIWFDLIMEDPDSLYGGSRDQNINARYQNIFWEHPAAALGIDTGVFDYKYEPSTPTYMLPMIMFFSAFPSFIEKYVKRLRIFTIEQAVYKTSTQAAKRYGLKGRGVINEGSYADIVLLDLDKLKVNGTPVNPRQQPSGIEYVFVNGEVVVRNAKHTNATPGKVLRKANK